MAFDNELILAIETSGRQGSVLLAQGTQMLAEKHFSGPMRHSAEIFPAIVELLSQFDKKPAQISQVYISIGPGSFTGLRIAVTIAKSLALANHTKIVTVDTLDCLAANVLMTEDRGQKTEMNNPSSVIRHQSSDLLAVILDAKRNQFFIAVYDILSFPRKRESSLRCPLNKILPDSLMTAEEFLEKYADKNIAITGEGLVFYKDKFAHKNVTVLDENLWYPSAANVYKLGLEKAQKGQFADPLTLIPNYLRGPDAKVKQV